MGFARPTLAALIDRAASDIEAALPGTDARLRRNNLGVLARVHAGAVHGLYGYLQWLAEQLMMDTCEATYLDRYASIWGVARRSAEYAQGQATITGASGLTLPAGTALQRADGTVFNTTVDATLASGTALVNVVADVAGANGNTAASAGLTMTVPVAGISSTATVGSAGLTAGTDAESDGELRARLLMRIRKTPMGGAAWDYEAWALEVPGVTRAWVYPQESGPGTVVLRFVRDDDSSLIPDSTEVAAVQSYVDARRPVCAAVYVQAPTASPLDLQITLSPNTVAVRDAVRAELADVLRREAAPGGTVLLSHLREAISIAAGEANHVLVSPTADVTRSAGYITTLGNITWS